jgi:beta-lactamase class A
VLAGCAPRTAPTSQWPAPLRERLAARVAAESTVIGLVLSDPATGATLELGGDRRFHAASTMKIPVLLELARRIDGGDLAWDDSLRVRNRFASVVDGSPFTLDPADDSDSTLYALEGRPVPIRRLAELMITRSSNLATNLVIDRLGARRVQATARALGADSIEVRRGVEDSKAYAAGLNNTATANDLARLLVALARGEAASEASSAEIVRILLAQEFNDRIPAGLPAGVPVAHKTGEITGVAHDAAIVYPPGGRPYVLVILTRGYADPAGAARLMAELSALVWEARRTRT